MKNKIKKLFAVLAGIALLSGLFLDFKDIKDLFHTQKDFSGEWYFEFHTTQSTYSDYIDAVTGYKMHLIQDGNAIKGEGETWKYNEELLPYSKHRPLEIEGIIKNDVLNCNYKLKGSERESTGSFKAQYKDSLFIGTFAGTAADANGDFKAKKIN